MTVAHAVDLSAPVSGDVAPPKVQSDPVADEQGLPVAEVPDVQHAVREAASAAATQAGNVVDAVVAEVRAEAAGVADNVGAAVGVAEHKVAEVAGQVEEAAEEAPKEDVSVQEVDDDAALRALLDRPPPEVVCLIAYIQPSQQCCRVLKTPLPRSHCTQSRRRPCTCQGSRRMPRSPLPCPTTSTGGPQRRRGMLRSTRGTRVTLQSHRLPRLPRLHGRRDGGTSAHHHPCCVTREHCKLPTWGFTHHRGRPLPRLHPPCRY